MSILVSGYRVDELVAPAHHRLYTIIIGTSLCILIRRNSDDSDVEVAEISLFARPCTAADLLLFCTNFGVAQLLLLNTVCCCFGADFGAAGLLIRVGIGVQYHQRRTICRTRSKGMAYQETKLKNNLPMEVCLEEVEIDHVTNNQSVWTTVNVSAYGRVYVDSDKLYENSKLIDKAMHYSISIGGRRTDARLFTRELKMNRNIVFNMNETNGEISYTLYPASKFGLSELRIFRPFRPPSGGQGEGVVTIEIRYLDT